MKNFFTDRKNILVIVVVSLLVRLLYLPIPFIINVADGAGYVAMADLALKGNWQSFLDDYIYRTPTYPFFIAFAKLIFGRFFVYGLPLVQHLLGVVMAVLVYFTGKKVFDKTVGFFAGLLTAANAYQVYWEHNSMSDFFFTFITVLSFYVFFNAMITDKKRDYVIFGTLLGFNLLTRPLFQAFFVFFPALIYLFVKNFKATLGKCALIMIPALIIISPWVFQHWYRHNYLGLTPFFGVQLMVRTQNYMDLESPFRSAEKRVYFTTMQELGKCTPEMIKADECGQVAFGGWVDLQRKLKYSPNEANQALTEIALEAIRKNPGRYLKETLEQMRIFLTKHARENFFGDSDLDPAFRERYALRFGVKDPFTVFHQEINWKLTPNPLFFFLFGFLGIALALFKRNKKSFLFILVFLYVFLLTSAIEEGGVTRYRVPLDPFVFLFASYAVIFVLRDLIFYNIRMRFLRK